MAIRLQPHGSNVVATEIVDTIEEARRITVRLERAVRDRLTLAGHSVILEAA